MDGDSVVVATDFSETSRAAARFGKQVAERLELPLVIVHVIESASNYWPGAHGILKQQNIQKRAQQRLDEWYADAVGYAPEEGDTRTYLGTPRTQLKEAADQFEPALMVIGMSGRSAADKLAFGSTAMELVYAPPCPVAVINPDHASFESSSRIAVGTDLSESSDVAIEFGAQLACLVDSPLDVVHSTVRPGIHSVDESDLPESLSGAAVYSRAKEQMKETIERNRDVLERLEAKSHILESLPSRGLSQFVEDNAIDLLVLGANPHMGGQAAVFWSVALKTVWSMKSSVIVVPTE